MSAPDLYVGGKRLDLLKRVGKGGEGEVWRVADDPTVAVKFYTLKDIASREAKIRAMVNLRLANTYKLVSYPHDVVTIKNGVFAGFTMSMVEGGHQIHELYGVKSRKVHFPDKDYRFLTRAAANTARAVAQVHASPCVIGDLNHSGILVGNDATVALIDADSFQLSADGKTYPCLVGVPEFTPPELQGKSLSGVLRTKIHDQFGLAVAIFQVLFMGRHPYAGKYKGPDLTLEEFIARNMFAYSLTRSTGVTPPPGMITLDAFPHDIRSAFERAFGTDPVQRPTAAEWVQNIKALEGQLSRCTADSSHYYPSAAKHCPWCKMEASTGAILFLPNLGGGAPKSIDISKFDVDRVWAAIRAITVPAADSVMPPIPAFLSKPSEEARRARYRVWLALVGGVASCAALLAAWVAYPSLGVLWVLLLVATTIFCNSRRVDKANWQGRYLEADRQFENAVSHWKANLGYTPLAALWSEMETAIRDYKGLPEAKVRAIAKLKAEREQRQLNEYLDRFLIERATIPGIGRAKTTTLRSFGIESAADVRRQNIIIIPGFGESTAEKLMAWRTTLERRFVYNSVTTPADAAAQIRLDAEFASKEISLSKKIVGGRNEMTQIAATIQKRMLRQDTKIIECARSRAQLLADLEYLSISRPVSRPLAAQSQPAHPIYPPSPRPSPIQPMGKSASSPAPCPLCGSAMVRRTARRGRRRGNGFWGCTRYPVCRGTRA